MDPANVHKLEEFFSKYKHLHFDKGEIILSPDTPLKEVYFLNSGFVRQFNTSSNGQELTIHIFQPGSFFPTALIFGNFKCASYLSAMESCEIFSAPKNEVAKFIEKSPQIHWDLTSRLLCGIGKMSFRIESLAFDNAYQRTISALIYLVSHFGTRGKKGITLPHFTHDNIAHISALTRERTSLEMEILQKKKLISYLNNRSIVIPNLKRLKNEYDKEK